MSISKKQFIANRRNAQKSTGPQTDQGKAVSSVMPPLPIRRRTKRNILKNEETNPFSSLRRVLDSALAEARPDAFKLPPVSRQVTIPPLSAGKLKT